MADEVVKVGLELETENLNADIQEVTQQVNKMRDHLATKVGSFEGMDQDMLDTFSSRLDGVYRRISDIRSSLSDPGLTTSMIQGLKASVGMITADIETLATSAEGLGNVFRSIPESMSKRFHASFIDMQREAQRLLSAAMSPGRTGLMSDKAMTDFLLRQSSFQKATTVMSERFGLSPQAVENLTKSIVRQQTPFFYRSDYRDRAVQASRGAMQHSTYQENIGDFRERLPERYRALPGHPEYKLRDDYLGEDDASKYHGVLTSSEYAAVKAIAAKNKTFERSLIAVGLAQRESHGKKAGALVMPKAPISKFALGEALGHMYARQFIPAMEGAPSYFRDVDSSLDRDQQALARKNSTVPMEFYAATEALDFIDVNPIFVDPKDTYKYNQQELRKGKQALTTRVGSIRPNSYQIMSLTYDDFKKGRVLTKDDGVQFVAEERPRSTSVNKMINQSIYTDLLGMHTHLSDGLGNKTNTASPRMVQIDFTDRLMKKDAAGDLEFTKDGVPAQDEETRKLIQDMFEKRASIKYRYDGEEHEYFYPVVSYGENGSYVPTNMKGGMVTLAREQEYVDMSKRFLQRFGVNVFDTLISDGMAFETEEGLSKVVEARNRALTPGVPIQELGGRLPRKNRIAFVNFGALKDADGTPALDGTSFWMPGFIPGGDGTIRSIGVKGLAQTVDFKTMIRDLYGEDTREFFAPTIGADEKMLELFEKGGIEAIRNATTETGARRYSDEDIAANFVDVMQYDALISDSMLKSKFFTHIWSDKEKGFARKRSHEETQDAFYDLLEMSGGLRMVRTAEEFQTTQSALSKQVSQNLDLTPEELEENARKWDEHIDKLRHDSDYARARLFSDPNDPLSRRIESNPALMLEDPLARERINDAISSATLSKAYNEIYADGLLQMQVALANPAEQILKLGRRNNLTIVDSELAKILSLEDSEDGRASIAAQSLIDQITMSALRYPNNQGEQFPVRNIPEYIDKIERYGMNSRGTYMNMATIAKMGGGDFDGDTIQLIQGKLSEIVERTYAARQKSFAGYTRDKDSLRAASKTLNRSATAADFADMLYRQAINSFQMGAVSNANDGLAQGDWANADWVKHYGLGAVDLRAMYDIDSTFAKTGVLANWTRLAKNASSLGKPFVALFKGLQGIADDPSEDSFKRLGDFAKVNFPSTYSGLTVSMLSSIRKNPMNDDAIRFLINAQEQLHSIPDLLASESLVDQAKGRFLRLNDNAMADVLMRGSLVSAQTEGELDSALLSWQDAINQMYPSGRLLDDEGKAARDKALREYQAQAYRIKHLKEFGLTERARILGQGYAGSSMMKEAPLTGHLSDFQEVFALDEAQVKEAARKARQSIVAGANPTIVDATMNMGANAAKAAMQAKADQLTYSYSMINAFESPRQSDREQWYANRILDQWPEKGLSSPEAAIGNALHAATEAWAKRRIKNQKDFGTSEDFEKEFIENLGKYHTADGKKILPNGVSPEDQSELANMYREALSFVRDLPQLLQDEEIVGTEMKVAPYLGDQILDPSKKVLTKGFVDLVTRKDGRLIYSDFKHRLRDSYFDQLYLYNAPRGKNDSVPSDLFDKATDAFVMPGGAQALRVISYGTADHSNPESFMKAEEFDPEKGKAVAQKYQTGVQKIQAFMAAGAPLAHLINGTPLPPTRSVVDEAAHGRVILQSAERFAADPSVIAEAVAKAITKKGKEDARITSRGISAFDELHDYEESLDESLVSLRGIEQGAGEKRTSNPWKRYANMVEFHQRRKQDLKQKYGEEFEEEDFITVDAKHAEFEEQYYRALAASASGDQKLFVQNTRDRIQARGTHGAAKQYADEMLAFEESSKRARQAYNQFISEIEARKSTRKLTAEEEKDLEKATSAYEEQEKAVSEYKELLRLDARDALVSEKDSLLSMATGKEISAEEIGFRAADKLKRRIDSYMKGVDLDLTRGLIDEETAAALKAEVEGIDIGAYGRQTTEQARLDNELQEARRARRTERLLINGRKLQRDPFGIRSNNFLDRAEERRDAAVDRYDNLIENYKVEIKKREATMASSDVNSDAYKKAADDVKKLTEALHSAEDASKSLAGAGGIASAAFAQMGESVTRVIQQFGRQMFHQAANEVKRFVQQYNADMTTIQMITLKTDEETSNLGADLIDTAIDLKVSVSDVTTAASEIYRQGLTDEEVDVRLEDTMKFSKVAGIKAEEASKILTTAMTNGLVETSEEAMDALVALDDSVATSASEIAKGMQKSAASAKEAGMSYQELVTSLAIITSRTQLSGSSAGTALSTLMYRLYKVGLGEDVYDENGNHIASTNMTQALDSIGVDMFENGQFRGPYQILVDIAKNWESADDIQREQILSTLGAGRQRANMATLIQGLAEDGGALAESYIDLATNSQGIADEKYLIYLESLPAAITNVQNSFDELIASFKLDTSSVQILDFISEMIQGFTAAKEASGGLVTGILGISTAVVLLSAAVKANPLLWGGMLAVGAAAGVVSSIGTAIKASKDAQEQRYISASEFSEYASSVRNRKTDTKDLISRMEKLDAKETLTAREQDEFRAGMVELGKEFSSVQSILDETGGSVEGLSKALEEAKVASDNLATAEIVRAAKNNAYTIADSIIKELGYYTDESNPLFTGYNPSEQEVMGVALAHSFSGGKEGTGEFLSAFPAAKSLLESIGDYDNVYGYWMNANEEQQRKLVQLTMLQDYMRQGASPADFAPESFWRTAWESGAFDDLDQSLPQLNLGSFERFYAVLRDGDLSSDLFHDVDRNAFDQQEADALRTYFWDYLAQTILSGSADQIKTDAIVDGITNSLFEMIKSITSDVDTESIALQFGQEIEEAFLAASNEDELVDLLSTNITTLLENMFTKDANGNFTVNKEWLEGYVDDKNKRIWKYADQYGEEHVGLTFEEAQAGIDSDLAARQPEPVKTRTSVDKDATAKALAGEYAQGDVVYSLQDGTEIKIGASYLMPDGSVRTYETEERAIEAYKKFLTDEFLESMKATNNPNLKEIESFEWDGKMFATKEDAEKARSASIPSSFAPAMMDADEIASYEESNAKLLSPFEALRSGSGSSFAEANKVALSADQMIETFATLGISSFEGLIEKVNAEAEGLQDLKNLTNEIPELGRLLEQGVLLKEDGSYEFVDGFWEEFYKVLADSSMSYQGTADPSRMAVSQSAAAALSAIGSGQEYDLTKLAGADDLQSIVGNELYGKLSTLARGSADYRLAEMLVSNHGYGISGLTAMQQVEGSQLLMNALANGTVTGLSDQTISTFGSSLSSMPQLMQMAEAIEGTGLGISAAEFAEMSPDAEGYDIVAAALEKAGFSAEGFLETLKDVNQELRVASIKASGAYGKSVDDVISAMDQWEGSAEDVASAQKGLNQALSKARENEYYRQQYKSGELTDDVLENIATQTGYDTQYVKEHQGLIEQQLDDLEKADIESIENWLNGLAATWDANDFKIPLPEVVGADGKVDLSAAANQMVGDAASQMNWIAQMLQAMYLGAHMELDGDGTNMSAKIVIDSLSGITSGYKPRGGGGGGGGNKKSSAEKLMESQDREQTIRDHIIKMIQYEETMYKNADELTNYGIMLQHEIDEEERQVQAKQANIAALKEEIAKTEKLSDEWYELRDAIMKAEEEVKDLQNTIDENLEALKENQQAILKLHTDLEQTVKEEIENRIAREEDMLSASVEMQDIVVEAIRHRYQEEWELMQEDIDKKKEALQEEISLIDERLQRRKDAEDEAEKYEQLAEYKRQLSLISMDSTRTADQATLREKIAELEKEIAWDTAEDQAEAQKESLQEQVDAYDEYVNDYQEYLDDLLEDANNFAEEVNGVMSLNQQQLFEWLKENVEEYSNSLDDAQERMVNSWEDTFKRMKGITDTYWQEIASVLTSKDSFLEYMKQSQSYLNASEDERKQMIYSWETMYDNYISATKVSQEAVDWTHSDDYATDSSASSSGSSGKTYRTNYTVYKADGTPYNGYGVGSTQSEADSNAAALKQAKLSNGYFATKPQTATTATSVSKNNKNFSAVQYTDGYSDGGYVDYTGLAIVHGTPSKPEAFLSAEDTSMIRGLLDSWKYVKARSFVSNLDSLFQGGQNNNIGEVNVVINQAELKEDADFEEVARRVGEVFTKELTKQGFSTAAYAL